MSETFRKYRFATLCLSRRGVYELPITDDGCVVHPLTGQRLPLHLNDLGDLEVQTLGYEVNF
jgi:hypothetical protein